MLIRCLCCASVLVVAALSTAAQEVQIGITGELDTRVPIAVPPFVAPPELGEIASEMAAVISYDLAFTGLFKILPPADYPPNFAALEEDVTQLNLDIWRQTEAEYLVYGKITAEGDALVTQLRLFDLLARNQVTGQELRAERNLARLIAHRFSEEVVRYLEGTAGIATSEIVFSGGATGRKEIYVADYDGANLRQVTEHNSISIMPEMSPDGNRIAYLSYKDRYGYLYVFDRRTGQSRLFSREVGLNAAPAWSPDGERIAHVLSKDGNTEIYVRGADGGNLTRLTNNRFGDTSPVFSPDGSRIAFVSDRLGGAQVFAMNADGSGQERLSKQGGSSYDPAWSPDGRYIAYVVEQRGQGLEIWMMNADGTNARRLTDSQGTNEAPSWSADSRHVVFSSTRAGGNRLYTVTIETGETRPVPNINIGAQGPSWGPRRN